MRELWQGFIRFFSSLQLTVVLLSLSIVLVLVATLDQVNLGIWAVQEKYFRCFFVMWHIPDSRVAIPVFPGGYLIGGMLLLNLLAAHVYRLRLTWKKSGLILTHAGLIFLLIGELISGIFQEDFQMQLQLREPVNYSESFLKHELVLIETTDAKLDAVTAIPESRLREGASIQHPTLPFIVKIRDYFPNCGLEMRDPSSTAPASPANQGVGPRVVATPVPVTYRPNERNMPAAYVELVGTEGSIGTWLVSPMLALEQGFTVGGRSYTVALRIERRYTPYTLTLTELHHDVYPGSDIPRNFSSRVRLQSPDGKDDREVLIYMNNPLRHGGYTFYQYQMNQASNFSVLQVVRNPGWQIPYISCIMMGLGLGIHFLITLGGFIRGRQAPASPASAPAAQPAQRAQGSAQNRRRSK